MEIDSILNLLFILVFVIGLPLLRLVGKNKKQRESSGFLQQQTQHHEGAAGFDMHGGEHKESPAETQEASEKEILHGLEQSGTAIPRPETDMSISNPSVLDEDKTSVVTKNKLRNNNKTAGARKSQAAAIADSFNIKKAVVFSEILKRKYF